MANAKSTAPAAAKAETKKTVLLPAIGDTVIYKGLDGKPYPLLVTSLGDESFSGQAFLHGTQVSFIEDAVFGDDLGQCSAK